MDVLKRFSDWLVRNRGPGWQSIRVDAEGFLIGSRRTDWAQITSIAAFKRDLLTIDDIWFQLESADGTVMVCEEQPGFDAWEAALCSRFPSVAGWREQIIQPAFAENFTVLFRAP